MPFLKGTTVASGSFGAIMRVGILIILLVVSGCSESRDSHVVTGERRIDLDRSNEERLLSYYLGGYLEPPGDPVAAGILRVSGDDFFLAPIDSLAQRAPILTGLSGDGVLEWAEFEAFIIETYPSARRLPGDIDGLREWVGDWTGPGWIHVTVQGAMSPYLRTVYVPEQDLLAALEERSRSGEILYPVGTSFVAEHRRDDAIVEWTLMRKRSDGNWDYAAYDAGGQVTDRVDKEPDPLRVPTQCLGCHVGNRAFEPERSFPATPADGPDGHRFIDAPESARDPEVVALLDEHARRSDTVLGLYATLYLSEMRSRARTGSVTEAERALLQSQGLQP